MQPAGHISTINLLGRFKLERYKNTRKKIEIETETRIEDHVLQLHRQAPEYVHDKDNHLDQKPHSLSLSPCTTLQQLPLLSQLHPNTNKQTNSNLTPTLHQIQPTIIKLHKKEFVIHIYKEAGSNEKLNILQEGLISYIYIYIITRMIHKLNHT